MPSFYSLLSLGIFVNPALSTVHFRQEIHPGHGGPPSGRLSKPSPSNQHLDQPSSSFAPPHQDPGRQRPVYDRPPHQAAAVIYRADSPKLSSPEHENESHSGSLFTLCQESPLSTIIFGSITAFSSSNGFPIANFSAVGCTRTRPCHDPWAPGLAVCQDLGDEVRRCQEMGKKVVLRIEGNGDGSRGSEGLEKGPIDGSTSLPEDVENESADESEQRLESGSALRFKDAPDARRAAVMLWKLFGQGDTHGPVGADSMRPLGDGVFVDGFDLAPFHRTSNTSPSQAYFFATFASTLHDLAHRRKNIKPCHVSATPACLPAAFFSFAEKVDELREAVDVVYEPVVRTSTRDGEDDGEGALEEGCAGGYRRVVEGDEESKLWTASSVPSTKEGEDEHGGDASGSDGEGRDELKV